MRRSSLGLAALAAAMASPASAQTVRAGIQAWQKADYAAAAAIWRPLAEKGDADAAFNLGQAYRLGRGVAPNIGAAQAKHGRGNVNQILEPQVPIRSLNYRIGRGEQHARLGNGIAEGRVG